MAEEGGGSRLDRLLRLIEAGSTPAARNEAARQIGEIASHHPNQLPNLLRRIRGFLKNKQWETRVAAAKAVSFICEGIHHATVADIARLEGISLEDAAAGADKLAAVKAEPNANPGDDDSDADVNLKFDEFDIVGVLDTAAPLLASKVGDFDASTADDAKLTKKERLRLAKQALKERLGMAVKDDGDTSGVKREEGTRALDVTKFVDVDDLVGEDDVEEKAAVKVEENRVDAADLSQLSARERNRLKRKQKRAARDDAEGAAAAAPASKKAKKGGEDAALAAAEAAEEEEEAAEVEAGAWPLTRTCESLAYSLFAARWEERHGAAAALREILRHHADAAAVLKPPARTTSLPPSTAALAAKSNGAWLEDMAVRLLCLLSLDRFGDYVGDGVVAPVRETGAQALGAGLLPLPPPAVEAVVRAVLVLLRRGEWEVRHSALLALRYVLAARDTLAPRLLPAALPAAVTALDDKDDDVRGAAAEALLPAARHLPSHQDFPKLLSALWGLLRRLDDPDLLTSPSNVPIMRLISALYALPETRAVPPAGPGSSLKDVVPSVFPFALHPIASVRIAVWRTLRRLMSDAELRAGWISDASVTAPMLRLLYQAILLEEDCETASEAQGAWEDAVAAANVGTVAAAVKANVEAWCTKAATAAGSRPDPKLLFVVSLGDAVGQISGAHERAPTSTSEWTVASVGRLRAVRALSQLAKVLCGSGDAAAAEAAKTLEAQVIRLMAAPKATWRMTGAHLLAQWLDAIPEGATKPPLEAPGARLGELLSNTNPAYPSLPSASPYAEVLGFQERVKTEATGLLRAAGQGGVQLTTSEVPSPAAEGFGAEHAGTLAAAVPQGAAQGPAGVAIESARSKLLASAAYLKGEETRLHSHVLSAAAGAAVAFGALPPKLNHLIQPLVRSIRGETDRLLQRRSARALACLIKLANARTPSPVPKIVQNIIGFACADPLETPRADGGDLAAQQAAAAAAAATAAAAAAAGSGDSELTEAAVARRGAEATLLELSNVFGESLFDALPRLWELMAGPLTSAPTPQSVIDGAQVLKVLGPNVHPSLQDKVLALIPAVFDAAVNGGEALQKTSAGALAALAKAVPSKVIANLLALVVPALEDSGEADSATGKRRGAAAVASALVTDLGAALAPYCVLMLVPLMGRMSDPVPVVREMATKSFASLVPLLPLARGRAPPPELSAEQVKRSENDGAFLEALLDNSKVEDFELPFKCNRVLRPYQQEGVNWLAFLRRFKLHGALCDDMGLGKTLQSTCILAATIVERKKAGLPHVPALVVCPPTLVGHWAHEINQYVAEDVLRPLEYHGQPGDRAKLQPDAFSGKYDVIIMSYDSLRSDAAAMVDGKSYSYCILDEGHAIRNPKARITQAVKKVRAEHRLLLSGTPIQNDVVELWSLFDFLMPGFLGTEREFKQSYGIASARSVAAKKGGGLTEQGALATGKLHKQVMPFVLRRTKDEVLKDLPPKIIQDIYVDLTPHQKHLYDAFEGSSANAEITNVISGGGESASGAATHVFQALQYLRKLCSHPRLVTEGDGKKGKKAKPTAETMSPKFMALKQILLDCGIGEDPLAEKDPDQKQESSGHRVLIFSQLKSLLDLVEDELFGHLLKGVSWLRLDGGVAPTARFDVVRKFNADPSIDVLLLTTHVGGLGLNLTSADTVVFLEHDWNPQKDLQAMDRAHRLGQKRTVNVFRLLTKGTLEEKIMGLQRFKLDVANAVVNTDNMSLSAMDTGQMLELFTADKGDKSGEKKDAGGENRAAGAAAEAVTGGLKGALAGLEELWDENQYKEEFALDGFIKSLNKKE